MPNDCVGGWHCPLPTRKLAKLLASEWEQDSCFFACRADCSDACGWKGGEQHSRHKGSLFSYSSRLKHHGTMFSRRSWFLDPLTCGWSSESRTQTDHDSHIWHRCPSSCCVVCEWIVPWIIVASIWKWKEFSLHLCPWDCGSFKPKEISHSLDVSRFHRVWYCLLIWEKGNKTAWKVWNAFPAVTDVFYALANPPVDVTGYVMAVVSVYMVPY